MILPLTSNARYGPKAADAGTLKDLKSMRKTWKKEWNTEKSLLVVGDVASGSE